VPHVPTLLFIEHELLASDAARERRARLVAALLGARKTSEGSANEVPRGIPEHTAEESKEWMSAAAQLLNVSLAHVKKDFLRTESSVKSTLAPTA
jgi:hypothetical protein